MTQPFAAPPTLADPLRPARRGGTILIVLGLLLTLMGGITAQAALTFDAAKIAPETPRAVEEFAAAGVAMDSPGMRVAMAVFGGLIAAVGLVDVTLGMMARRGTQGWVITGLIAAGANGLVGLLVTVIWALTFPPSAVVSIGFVAGAGNAVRWLVLAARQSDLVAAALGASRHGQSLWPARRHQYA